MVFVRAGPAEILRSSQRDDSILKKIELLLENVLLRYGGPRMSMKYKYRAKFIAHLLYYSNTTMSNLQTLGEEYTGILQVDRSLRNASSFVQRLMMVILECFGATIATSFLSLLEQLVQENNDLVPDAKIKLLNVLCILKKIIPFINHLHKAYFFCHWDTYQLSKRIAGINYIIMVQEDNVELLYPGNIELMKRRFISLQKYGSMTKVLVRYWLKDSDSLYGFKFLGIITFLNLIILAIQSSKDFITFGRNISIGGHSLLENRSEYKQISTKICSMCLNNIRSPSCTPCGHIYCWTCILEWLNNDDKCPLCREVISSSRVVQLMNYC